MTISQKAILRTLLYFDLFSHPLDKTELFAMLHISEGPETFEHDLEDLLAKKLIGLESGYFFLVNGRSSIQERIIKLERSLRYHRVARFISALIFWFPFVRGIMISGSLSKNSHSKKDDIDFFVISRPGRIWVCRTLLMLFKKIFLLNSKKYFCINYFIDSETLEIPEKNIFTATELAFLIPQRNTELCRQFLEANDWVRSFFPNLKFNMNGCRDTKDPFLKMILERTLNGETGDKLDTRFMEMYRKRSLKKFGKTEPADFNLNFRNDKNVSKYHPRGFQQIILEQYVARISEFEAKQQVDLTV